MKFRKAIHLKEKEYIEIGAKITLTMHSTGTKFTSPDCECCCICGKELADPLRWTKVANTYYIICGDNKCRKEAKKRKMLEKMEDKD